MVSFKIKKKKKKEPSSVCVCFMLSLFTVCSDLLGKASFRVYPRNYHLSQEQSKEKTIYFYFFGVLSKKIER